MFIGEKKSSLPYQPLMDFVDLVTVLEQSGSQMDPFLSESECFPCVNQTRCQKIGTCSHQIGFQTLHGQLMVEQLEFEHSLHLVTPAVNV